LSKRANKSEQPTEPAPGREVVDAKRLAELFALTEARVYQLAKEGAVVQVGRGKFDTWASVRGYIRFLQGVAKNRGGDGYERARERLYNARADKAEIEAALARGQVHDAEAVAELWTEQNANVRAKVLAIPAIAPQLETMTTAERKEALEDACRAALAEASEYDPKPITERWARANGTAVSAPSEEAGAAAEAESL